MYVYMHIYVYIYVCVCVYIYIYIYIRIKHGVLRTRIGLYNTPTASLQKGKPPTNNEYPIYDTKQYDGDLKNAEYPFIAIAPSSTLARSGSFW